MRNVSKLLQKLLFVYSYLGRLAGYTHNPGNRSTSPCSQTDTCFHILHSDRNLQQFTTFWEFIRKAVILIQLCKLVRFCRWGYPLDSWNGLQVQVSHPLASVVKSIVTVNIWTCNWAIYSQMKILIHDSCSFLVGNNFLHRVRIFLLPKLKTLEYRLILIKSTTTFFDDQKRLKKL